MSLIYSCKIPNQADPLFASNDLDLLVLAEVVLQVALCSHRHEHYILLCEQYINRIILVHHCCIVGKLKLGHALTGENIQYFLQLSILSMSFCPQNPKIIVGHVCLKVLHEAAVVHQDDLLQQLGRGSATEPRAFTVMVLVVEHSGKMF